MYSLRFSLEKNGYSGWVEDVENASQGCSNTSWWRDQLEGFKFLPNPPLGSGLSRYERSVNGVAALRLLQGIKPRHIHMIALCGAIGSGLFITPTRVIYSVGPGALLIGYFLLSSIMLLTLNAAAELAVEFPTVGAFSAHASRFVDSSWGFALGWIYLLQWLVALPTELNAIAILLYYWELSRATAFAIIGVALVVIMFFHLFPVSVFGEIEFCMSVFKILLLLIFIIASLLIICGVNSDHYYYGARYFVEPGSFVQGARGVFSFLVGCSWAFLGCEICVLTAAETPSPQVSIPRAVKQVFWRCTILYMCCAVLISCLVSYNDPAIVEHTQISVIFMIAIIKMGNTGLTHFFRAGILVALLSSAYSAVYVSTRTMVSLAAQGHAPNFMGRIDRRGRSLPALGLALAFGTLGFASPAINSTVAFAWLSNFNGITGLIVWISINLNHLRFRLALKEQGVSLDTLLCRSPFGIHGSIISILVITGLLCTQLWATLATHYRFVERYPTGTRIALVYLGLFVTLVVFCVHKLIYRDGIIKLKNIDLNTGKRAHDIEAKKIAALVERHNIAQQRWWYRWYRFWC